MWCWLLSALSIKLNSIFWLNNLNWTFTGKLFTPSYISFLWLFFTSWCYSKLFLTFDTISKVKNDFLSHQSIHSILVYLEFLWEKFLLTLFINVLVVTFSSSKSCRKRLDKESLHKRDGWPFTVCPTIRDIKAIKINAFFTFPQIILTLRFCGVGWLVCDNRSC